MSDNLSPHAQRAYIDTMLFVYQLGRPKSDTFHKLALQFFLDIESGKYEGVITTLTKSEYVAVMKEHLSQRNGASLTLNQLNTIKSDFETFVDKEGIELLDSDDLSTSLGRSEIFRWSNQVVENCRAIMGSNYR